MFLTLWTSLNYATAHFKVHPSVNKGWGFKLKCKEIPIVIAVVTQCRGREQNVHFHTICLDATLLPSPLMIVRYMHYIHRLYTSFTLYASATQFVIVIVVEYIMLCGQWTRDLSTLLYCATTLMAKGRKGKHIQMIYQIAVWCFRYRWHTTAP